MDYNYYDQYGGSQESLYSLNNFQMFTPPATRPKNNVFFNSDDNLYKTERRKFQIPRIEIESDEPVFNLQVTDFSEPSPKNITLTYDETGTSLEISQEIAAKSGKDRANDYAQQKSFSLEVEIPQIRVEEVCDTDKFLSIGARKLKQQNSFSCSLQDVSMSSSTSSINSCVHESNLDLSQIDVDTPVKLRNWRSPDEIRQAQYIAESLENKANSVPELCSRRRFPSRSKSVSEEALNEKLTEFERLEVIKLLRDWSINGSDSKSDYCLKLRDDIEKYEIGDTEKETRGAFSLLNRCKYFSVPDLSPKTKNKLDKDGLIYITKYNSDNAVDKSVDREPEFLHACQYRNCIFNVDFTPDLGTNFIDPVVNKQSEPKLKGILKNSKEKLNETECLNNVTNLQRKCFKLDKSSRRFSEIIQPKPFNSQLVRCDSLERLTLIQNKTLTPNKDKIRAEKPALNGAENPSQNGTENPPQNGAKKPTQNGAEKPPQYGTENPPQNGTKKFPDSYIVTRRNSTRTIQKTKNNEATKPRSPKVILLRKKYVPKTWKSCSDIKAKKTVRKCCRYAKKTCPVLKFDVDKPRKTRSCSEFDQDNLERAARLAGLVEVGASDRPRRMSERDLPSRVDSERTIPSSKSVPALHHISPNSEQSRPSHDVFNPGYSRTSSNNSINMNSAGQNVQNGPTTLRSRSTHNLHQQDGGFYQNLSVYRNKVPSPQQLGDRTSALRSSQNSLQSSVANSQRPASAYYPPPVATNPTRSNLHQSIPNLKSPPSLHRLQSEESRSGSYPSVNHQQYVHNYNQNTYPGSNQSYNSQSQNYPPNNYHSRQQDDYGAKMPYSPVMNSYSNPPSHQSNFHQPLHIQANGGRTEDRYNGGGLLREDVFRQSQAGHMRISEAQLQHNRIQEDFNRQNEMRNSKSEDLIKQHLNNDSMRYASSGNIRAYDSKTDLAPLRSTDGQQRLNSEQRGQAKLVEMGEELRRRQNRVLSPPYSQQQYYNHHGPTYTNQSYTMQMAHNTQSMQNLNLTHQNYPPYQQNYYQQTPTSPTSYKSPPVAPKPKKIEDAPELPPTSTHPLYSASSQDPPKIAFYSTQPPTSNKTPKDPWAREEQERQAEARREASRLWQEQQIRELSANPHRTNQQDEQLRILQLEREFQRRALEADQEDEETEKESPIPQMSQPIQNQGINTATTSASTKVDTAPTSILKPGISNAANNSQQQQPSPTEPAAPPPPERGSSFAVMSIRHKENTKRVSFNDINSTPPQPPSSLQIEETIREDPNSFIRQAESMLASPTTPTDASPGISTATPGVIGAQEVYRDPRQRRLAEQAQQKNMTTPVPEKLSFKEKMKMFAMETGEQETPKDKSKISRAQREIDSLGAQQQQTSSLVH